MQIWIPVANNPATDPYAPEDKRAAFLLEIIAVSRFFPASKQSSLAGNDTLPMNSGRNYSPFSIQGRTSGIRTGPVADIAVVDAQYFRTMEVPLISRAKFHALGTHTELRPSR